MVAMSKKQAAWAEDVVAMNGFSKEEIVASMVQADLNEQAAQSYGEAGPDDYEYDFSDVPWEQYLGTAGYKELCETVRLTRVGRADRKKERNEKGYREAGCALYELQKALKTRFGIDIAKVK